MNIIIEVNGSPREVTEDFKIYGTKEDLLRIAEDIREAVYKGLAQGWVGLGPGTAEAKDVFPNNGPHSLNSKSWGEVA